MSNAQNALLLAMLAELQERDDGAGLYAPNGSGEASAMRALCRRNLARYDDQLDALHGKPDCYGHMPQVPAYVLTAEGLAVAKFR